MRYRIFCFQFYLSILLTLSLLSSCKDLGIQRGSIQLGSSYQTSDKRGELHYFKLKIEGDDLHSSIKNQTILEIEGFTSTEEYAEMHYYLDIFDIGESGYKSLCVIKSATTDYEKELFYFDRKKRLLQFYDKTQIPYEEGLSILIQCKMKNVILLPRLLSRGE